MIEVIENFFTEEELNLYKSEIHKLPLGPIHWCEKYQQDPIAQMISKVWSKYSDVQSAGYEYWKHDMSPGSSYNSVDWHFDGDEFAIREIVLKSGFSEEDYSDPIRRVEMYKYLRDNHPELNLPIMGCAIYLDTEGLVGGLLEVDDGEQIHSLSPKTNSVAFFKAGHYNHRVTAVEAGVRISVASNLWAVKPSEANYVRFLS